MVVDRSEGFGERLLGTLLDRAHQMPPQLIAPLVAEEAARIGGRDVCILLQDYCQRMLRPLPGRGLVAGEPEPVDGSAAGRAFLRMTAVEEQRGDGVRMYLPLLDGSDEVGVLALTLDAVDEDDRRLLRRLAGLVADMLVTKNAYTDQFFQARRSAPMSLSAEIQWALLPPVGFGGATPVISEHELRRGDRVLFFTDGAIEEHKPGGQQFGMERFIDFVERAGQAGEGVQEMVRGLSLALARARDGVTTDDTTLFLVEWGAAPPTTSPRWPCDHPVGAGPRTSGGVCTRHRGLLQRRRPATEDDADLIYGYSQVT
jgi:Stage II sporulation protein E (SpoIIE)